jgi:archaellum component FlaG (FlaF/FlaG flagellin family)
VKSSVVVADIIVIILEVFMFARVAAVSAIVVLALSGCTPDPTKEYSVQGEEARWTIAPAGNPVVDDEGVETTGIVVDATEEKIFVNTLTNFTINVGGSGSCPPIVEGVELNKSSGAVDVNMYEYPANTACTADYVMYAYNVSIPSNAGYHFVGRDFNVCYGEECSPFEYEVMFETRQ